jgi:hypothetical protein
MAPPRWRENKFKILGGALGVLVFAGAVFGAYKLGQKQIYPEPVEGPTPGGQKVFCEDPRPEVCTMECIVKPPFICGSDGKSYCSECQACSNPKVEWYVMQDEPCKGE